MSATLGATIHASLAPLAAAREYAMAYPEGCKPVSRVCCPSCGSGRLDWPLWISLTERCSTGWHA